MNQEIYLIGGSGMASHQSFRDQILATATELVEVYQPERLWVTLTESPPPRLTVIPFKRGKIAAFTVFRQPEDIKPYSVLTEKTGFRSAFRVEEAIPVSYAKNWPNGQPTPGICLLTLFRQRKDIPYSMFIDRWHNSHTPLSLKIHPLWHYNRNVVLKTIAAAENPWGGIVEEHFRQYSDLVNPFKFFGNPMVILQHMLEVYRDTNSFLDYKTIEPWLVREYHMK